MRIEKEGKQRTARAAVITLMLLSAAACNRGDKAPGAQGAPSKSTQGDTNTATGQTATGAASPSASVGRKARVVILGTSLTAGLGLDPSEAYPALLQSLADSAHYAVNIVAAGLSGETSAGALRRAGWVLDQAADAVVLEVGANDGLRGVNPDSTQANIEALVDAIRKRDAATRIVLVQMEAPPNFGRDYATHFHNAYAAVSRTKHIDLLPFLLDSVAGFASLNQSDGLHPNRAGSKIVARNMFRALGPLFTTLSASPPAATK